MDNSRRGFIKKAAITGGAIIAAPAFLGATESRKIKKLTPADQPFRLKYAPSFGMFEEHAGKDLADNVKFCYDMGFRAMFDNGLMSRPVEDQVKIATEFERGQLIAPVLEGVKVCGILDCHLPDQGLDEILTNAEDVER